MLRNKTAMAFDWDVDALMVLACQSHHVIRAELVMAESDPIWHGLSRGPKFPMSWASWASHPNAFSGKPPILPT